MRGTACRALSPVFFGDGDVIEIDLAHSPASSLTEQLQTMGLEVQTTDQALLLRGRSMVQKLPAVLELLEKNGVHADETRMRSHSLEDVFISMTGRRLRE